MTDFTVSNIEHIEFTDEEMEMMDMEVEDVHCFYANGILVHNCAQEMRLTANFSGEPHLINPILEGKDIHNYIAKQMFGFEDPEHRTKVKICNFCVNYGGGPPTLANKLGISVEEANKLLDHYNQTLSTLSRWKKEVIKEARRKGMVFTYFGRPRLLYPYYNSSDKSMWGFADRTAINSPIQGTGGDLIRIDHVKLLELFKNDKEFAENCRYACTVHDEINLFVKPSYLKQAFNKLVEIMYFKPKNFKIPIAATPSVGIDWGHLIDCDFIEDSNKLVPDFSKVLPLDW